MITEAIDAVYEAFQGSQELSDYMDRHGVTSAGILTIYDDEKAALVAEHLADHIRGKVVVEIGAGIGLLACHLAEHAFKVYAIEASPIWASCFAVALLRRKPANLTYILGSASEMVGILRADVSLFCTHSGVAAMREVGAQFAPVVIDVYADVMKFDRATQISRGA